MFRQFCKILQEILGENYPLSLLFMLDNSLYFPLLVPLAHRMIADVSTGVMQRYSWLPDQHVYRQHLLSCTSFVLFLSLSYSHTIPVVFLYHTCTIPVLFFNYYSTITTVVFIQNIVILSEDPRQKRYMPKTANESHIKK